MRKKKYSLNKLLIFEFYWIVNEDCVCRGSSWWRGEGEGLLICAASFARADGRTDRRWPSAPGDKRGEISSVTIWLVAFQLSICLRDSHSGGLVGGVWGLHTQVTVTGTHAGRACTRNRKCGWNWPFAGGGQVRVTRAESRTRFSPALPGEPNRRQLMPLFLPASQTIHCPAGGSVWADV